MTACSVISETLDPTEFGIVAILCIAVSQRHRLVCYSLMLTTVITSKNLLKLIYCSNRPFWVDNTITSGEFSCSRDFAMPSGHSAEGGAVATFLFLDLMVHLEDSKYIWVTRILAGLFTFVYVFIMGFSRAFTGAHSWD